MPFALQITSITSNPSVVVAVVVDSIFYTLDLSTDKLKDFLWIYNNSKANRNNETEKCTTKSTAVVAVSNTRANFQKFTNQSIRVGVYDCTSRHVPMVVVEKKSKSQFLIVVWHDFVSIKIIGLAPDLFIWVTVKQTDSQFSDVIEVG